MKQTQQRTLAVSLSEEIRTASWLGKHSMNARGREIAYRVKALKLSNALVRFGEFFKVISIELGDEFGILLLIRLADGRGAHVPWSNLSVEAQLAVRAKVSAMLDKTEGFSALKNAA